MTIHPSLFAYENIEGNAHEEEEVPQQKKSEKFVPKWREGDWWVLDYSEASVFSSVPEWALSFRFVYKVVERKTLRKIDCFVVERWMYPLDVLIDQEVVESNQSGTITDIFYYRVKSKTLIKRITFEIDGSNVKRYQRDFHKASLPYVSPAHEWLPAFPLKDEELIYKQYKSYDFLPQGAIRLDFVKGKWVDFKDDVQKSIEVSEGRPLVEIKNRTAYDVRLFYQEKDAEQEQAGDDLLEGRKEFRRGRQIWVRKLPWFAFFEIEVGWGVPFGRYWLTQKGREAHFTPYSSDT